MCEKLIFFFILLVGISAEVEENDKPDKASGSWCAAHFYVSIIKCPIISSYIYPATTGPDCGNGIKIGSKVNNSF